MILYKYISFESGLAVLQSHAIGYSRPPDLNDPFEVSSYYGVPSRDDFSAQLIAPLLEFACLSTWQESTAILSLTRTPLNPLMWSHYAVNHMGFVFGFDAARAGFTDEQKNLVPAQFGNVVYTRTKPTHGLLSEPGEMQVGHEYSYRHEISEKLERLFLYKAAEWAYEEEVRVVKCIREVEQSTNSPSGPLTVISPESLMRPLYLAPFAAEAVTEIYLGARNPLLSSENSDVVDTLKSYPAAKLFGCRVADVSWELETFEYKL